MNSRRGRMRYIDFASKLILQTEVSGVRQWGGHEGCFVRTRGRSQFDFPSRFFGGCSWQGFNFTFLGNSSRSRISWQCVSFTQTLFSGPAGVRNSIKPKSMHSNASSGRYAPSPREKKVIYKADRRHVQLQDTASKSHTSKVTLWKVTLRKIRHSWKVTRVPEKCIFRRFS